jgi:hypothetical protein
VSIGRDHFRNGNNIMLRSEMEQQAKSTAAVGVMLRQQFNRLCQHGEHIGRFDSYKLNGCTDVKQQFDTVHVLLVNNDKPRQDEERRKLSYPHIGRDAVDDRSTLVLQHPNRHLQTIGLAS